MEKCGVKTSKTVFLTTSVENARKMLENLDRASELIAELKDIFNGWGENGIRLEENFEVKEIDEELIEQISERVCEQISEKL